MKRNFLIAIFLIFTFIGNAQTWTVYGGMPQATTRCSAKDASGNLWVAVFGSGVAKLTGSSYINYDNTNSGLTDNNVTYSVIDNLGNKWFGTFSGGAFMFDNTNWTQYNNTSGLPGNRVNCIAIDANNTKWFGIQFQGVTKYDGTTFTTYKTTNSSLPNNNVNAITIDGNNKWIATYGGLAKFDGTNWTVYTSSTSGIAHDQVYAVAVESPTAIWVGTAAGLCKFNGTTGWTTYNTDNSGLPYNYVSAIAIDSQGNKWIGTTQGGMAKFDGTNWTVFNTSNSNMPGMDVRHILVDANDNKWISTNDGGFAFYGNPGGASNIATLQSITLTQGVLNPVFSPTVYNYTVTLPYGTAIVPTVTATPTDNNATVVINQATDFSSNNVATIEVTAEDGVTTALYSIAFNVAAPSNVATLSNISLSAGTLNPAFSSNIYNYSVEMPYSTVSVPTVTPTLTDPTATITNLVQASDFTTNNVATIEVTAQDGITVLTYTVTFTKAAPSNVATLSSITLSQGALNPPFNSSIFNYFVELPYATTVIPNVSVTLTDNTASINQINATDFVVNNVTSIIVTAQDGVTTNTYTITFTKAAPSNIATLSNIILSQGTLNPAFNENIFNYLVELPYGTTNVPTVTPVLTDPNATISNQVNATDFSTNNTTTIVVTAEDGVTSNTYSIVFTLLQNTNNINKNSSIFAYNTKEKFLTISCEECLYVQIQDVIGNRVIEKETDLGVNRIDLHHLNAGIYIVRLIKKDGIVISKKIVVQ